MIIEVWLIIDTIEHSDLVKQIKDGTLRKITCSNCYRRLGYIDAPLLLYSSDQNFPFIFSPAYNSNIEESKTQAINLLAHIQNMIGDNWHKEWNTLTIIPYDLLPLTLIEGMDSAFSKITERIKRSKDTYQILDQLISTTDWEDLKTLLQNLPNILSKEIDYHLEKKLINAKKLGNKSEEKKINNYYVLLSRCRKVGIEQALAEQSGGLTLGVSQELSEIVSQLDQPSNIEDIPRLVCLCQEALLLVPRNHNPWLWAVLQAELGKKLTRSQSGNLVKNIELAIVAYKRSLQVRNRTDTPIDWAHTIANMATAYAHRLKGNKSKNIEIAITLYNQALEILSCDTEPFDWADITINLANTYQGRIEGNHANNLELAITLLQQALEVLTLQTTPLSWADAKMNLANIFYCRTIGNRAENLELAIKAYKEALQIHRREDNPITWAQTTMNMAIVFFSRIQGDRSENIEQAIESLEQTLEILTQEKTPIDWAKAKTNLAIAYYSRTKGNQTNNIDKAIEACEQALQVRTRKTLPIDWAQTMTNLGNAYSKRTKGGHKENLEKAKDIFQQALQVRMRETLPIDWAQTMMNLANVYNSLTEIEPLVNVDCAIKIYKQVLDVVNQESMPIVWASIMVNLGISYSNNKLPDKEKNIELAISCFTQALEIFSPTTLPENCRSTAKKLGNIFFNQHNWIEAIKAYKLAIEATEFLYRSSIVVESRKIELVEIYNVYRKVSYALAASGQLQEAAIMLEQGRARELSETLIRDHTDLGVVKHTNPEIYKLYQQATNYQKQIELVLDPQAYLATPTVIPLLQNIRETAQENSIKLSEAIAGIRSTPGFEKFLAQPTFSEISSNIPKEAVLLYLTNTSQGSLALIITPKKLDVIFLDFNETDLNNILLNYENDKIVGGYLFGQLVNPEYLKSNLNNILQILGNLITPIVDHLRKSQLEWLILIPTGRLSLLPLHAALYYRDEQIISFLDEFNISYAPNARVISMSLEEAQKRGTNFYLIGVGNPLPNLSPLKAAEGELSMISTLFPENNQSVLYRENATKDALLKVLPEGTHLHFACHGTFDVHNPLDSRLLLANQEPFTLQELIYGETKPIKARLAVLSACQSAITDFYHLPDEFIGLPAGFLQAGVPGVIGSLWPVDDLSTSLLMTKFYDIYLQERISPVKALLKAQRWLRNATASNLLTYIEDCITFQTTNYQVLPKQILKEIIATSIIRFELMETELKPFNNPYFWAAFIFVGV